MVVKLIFRPKPTSGANFIKIGVGRRTGPYTRLFQSLTDGLLISSNVPLSNTISNQLGVVWRYEIT